MPDLISYPTPHNFHISVTITSIGGCNGLNATLNTVLQKLALPTVTITTPPMPFCNGSEATLNASGADTYKWNPGNFNGNPFSVSPAVPTKYIVTGTDLNGCSNIAESDMIYKYDDITASIQPSDYNGFGVSCFGESDGSADLTVTSGVPPFNFLWNNNGTTNDINNISAGVYYV
ncbi:MAG: SprB repeat-containing protein, partial [Bacteroidetes bacterium]|nr:SprB repeat-containing protein [Bacteroidota bacterium]